MAKLTLPKYTLQCNEKTSRWDLKQDGSKTVVKSFNTKAAALKGGVLAKIVKRGSVKIQKQNGKFQEERTYPRSADKNPPKG